MGGAQWVVVDPEISLGPYSRHTHAESLSLTLSGPLTFGLTVRGGVVFPTPDLGARVRF